MVILPLTERTRSGRFCLVDSDDYEWAVRGRWPYRRQRCRGEAGQRGNLLHRAIAQRAGLLADQPVIVHRNGWTLDNRRLNLLGQQPGRRKALRNIHRNKTGWRVYIGTEFVGHFDTAEAASNAHEAAARDRGYLTSSLQAELLAPVIQQLEEWVVDGRLIRHIANAPLIEDRYRLNFRNPNAPLCCS